MLTVNIQYDGKQVTLEAKEVEAKSNNKRHDEVCIIKPSGDIYSVYRGRVFVMNEQGSTVARYDLSVMDEPPKTYSSQEPEIA